MKKLFTLLVCVLLYSAAIQVVFAQQTFHANIPDVPTSPGLVFDYGQMLSDDEEEKLSALVVNYYNESSNEIAVVTVDNLGGLDISTFANELGRKWDIGDKEKKNGVVVLVSKTDKKINISPGYGLQGALPDVICSRIIRDDIVPNFRAGQVYNGLSIAVTHIIAATRGEFTQDDLPNQSIQPTTLFVIIFFFILIVIVLSFVFRNKKNIYVSRRGYSYGDDWQNRGGGWFSSGGSWGGNDNDSGGGFGGFGGGGGGFDGGGASGSW